jgi:acetylornithine deacetylase/succinyl-diaminopimelate desuccinylase-like protein
LSDELRARFERAGLLELAQALVRVPSHPGVERQEAAVVEVLRAYLEGHGIACEVRDVAPGRPNLVARVAAERAVSGAADGPPGRTLVLCGHTDTVPLNADDPGVGFSGEVRDGFLLGRGAVDMKGPVAAMAAALVVAQEDRRLAAGELILAAVVDEEMESLGCEALVRDLQTGALRADAAIVGEPTSNRVALGHKGLEWLAVEFTGRSAHGGTPHAGVSAILGASRFLARVEAELQPTLRGRTHPLLGPPTINPGTIRGGDQPSTVAARCTIEFDRRTVPGETFETVIGELSTLARAVEATLPGLAISIRRLESGMATMEHLPLEISPSHPLVAALTEVVTGRRGNPEATSFPAWTDGALLWNFGRVPTVVLGPGDLAHAHSPREALSVDELFEAAAIYLDTASRYCAGAA